MSNVDLGSMTGPSGPGLSRYSFTDSHGYRVGPVIEAASGAEARDRIVAMTGHAGGLHCSHLSDYHSLSPVAALPDPEDVYDYLFPQ